MASVKLSLNVEANVQQATKSLQQLENQLSRLSSGQGIPNLHIPSVSKEVAQATKDVNQLQISLKNAFNQDTGKLDLTKFNRELKRSNKTLDDYQASLSMFGAEGQKAFLNLASSILRAEAPLKRSSALMQKLKDTFANTIRWQISSSALNTLVGSVQQAYYYAKDLNKSLTDIRIVSNQSADQMAQFAKYANQAAKSLSTTTTAYTDAALIYYQQGLSDKDVQARTNTTIKMANVTGQSAVEVSNQMTAIWNNFAEGSRNLEYYADVITALGAATASSSEEIAGGLEKFAAIANTVGLSYEYATSALATVTAQTRQSEDVVGTAFKSIFARIQGLELGETLEDGVNLNKYSEALSKIGVNILDTTGHVKEMDDILDEMGTKWKVIGQEEKIAVAQTVAGMRQYNQLVALMDNWDIFKQNVNIAETSAGTIESQSKIYEESWEAASKHVRASLESIYSDLLNDKFFIQLNEFLADALDLIHKIVDGAGGFKTVLLSIAPILSNIYSKEIVNGVRNVKDYFTPMKKQIEMNQSLRQQAAGSMRDMVSEQLTEDSPSASAIMDSFEVISNEYFSRDRELSESERNELDNLYKQLKVWSEISNASGEHLKNLREILKKDDLYTSNDRLREINSKKGKNEKKVGKDRYSQDIDIAVQNHRGMSNLIDILDVHDQQKGLSWKEAKQNIKQYIDNNAAFYKENEGQFQVEEGAIEVVRHPSAILNDDMKDELAMFYEENYGGDAKKIKEILTKFAKNGKIGQKQQKLLRDLFEKFDIYQQNNTINDSVEKIITSKKGPLHKAYQDEYAKQFKLIEQEYEQKGLGKKNKDGNWHKATLKKIKRKADEQTKKVFESRVKENLDNLTDQSDTTDTAFKKAQGNSQNIKDKVELSHDEYGKTNTIENYREGVTATVELINGMNLAGVALEGLRETISGTEGGFTKLTSSLSGLTIVMSRLAGSAENFGKIGIFKKGGDLLGGLLKKAGTSKLVAGSTIGKGLIAAGGSSFLPMIAAMGGIYAIKKGYQAWDEHAHGFERKIEAANQKLQTLRETTEKASGELDDLLQIRQITQDSYAAMDKLTEGTDEWYLALSKVNQQMLELIEKFPELRYDFIEGRIVLDESSIAEVIYKQRKQVAANTQAQFNAQVESQKLNSEQNLNDEIKHRQSKIDNLYDEAFENLIKKYYNKQTGSIDRGTFKEDVIKSQENGKSLAKYLGDVWSQRGYSDNLDIEAILEKNFGEKGIYEPLLLEMENYLADIERNTHKLETLKAENWLEAMYPNMEEATKTSLSHKMSADLQDEEFLAEIDEKYKSITFSDRASLYEMITGFDAKDADSEEIERVIKENLAYSASVKNAWENYDKIYNFNEEGVKGKDLLSDSNIADLILSGYNFNVVNDLTKDEVKSFIPKLQQLISTGSLSENDELAASEILKKITSPEYAKISQENQDINYQRHLESTAMSLDVDPEALKMYVEHLQATNEELADNRDLALEVAEAEIRYSEAVDEVNKVLDKNKDALDTPGTMEYYEAITEVAKATRKMLNIDVSNDYVEEHLQDIQDAANGSEEAINKLQKTAAVDWGKNFLNSINSKEDLLNSDGEILVDQSKIEDWKNNFLTSIQEVSSAYAGIGDSFDIDANMQGVNASMATLIESMNKASEAGLVTREQIEGMFQSFGFTPEIKMEKKKTASHTRISSPEIKSTIDLPLIGNREITIPAMDYEMTSESDFEYPIIGDSNLDGDISFGATHSSSRLSNLASSRPGKKSGGGSKKSIKDANKEIDRYHVIKEQIEDLTHDFDELNKAKDRAFGGDKVDKMNEEIAKLKQMTQAENAYLSQIKQYYSLDKAAIAAYGAQFDQNGVITNYDQIMQDQINKYNNNLTDEGEEAYNKFKEALQQYEETSDLLQEQEAKITDLQNQYYDALVEKLEYIVKLKLDVADDDLKYYDYMMKNIGEGAEEAADAIELLGKKSASNLKKIKAYEEGLNGLFANHGYQGDITQDFLNGTVDINALSKEYKFTESEVETLREYRDGLMDISSELLDLQQEVHDKVLSAFEELSSEFDDIGDKIKHLTSLVDSFKNIIDIVGQDALGITDELMESLDNANMNNALNNLEVTYNKLNAMKESRAEAQESLSMAQQGKDEKLIKFWEDTLAEIDKQINDAEEEHMSSWEEAVQSAADVFQNSVERSIKHFEKAMSGTYGTLDKLQDAYDKKQQVKNRYLEDYEQIYKLSKLNRDIENSIDDTENIRGKQALADIQREITELQERGVKLSEYDVDFLRKKYELRLAAIALEDAQNAKSQVRMTRDNEGNWSYTYTADQDAVNNAQQNYEDKLFEIQQLSSKYIGDMQSQILEAQKSMVEELSQLRADDEEGRQQVVEHWTGQIEFIKSQMQNALDNNKMIYEEDWTWYNQLTDYKISADEEFIDSFDETILSQITGFETLEDYQNAFTENSLTLLDELSEAYHQWSDNTEEAMKRAGTSTEDFKDKVSDAVSGPDGIIEQSNAAKDNALDMKDKMIKSFSDIINAVNNFDNQYGKAIKAIIDNNNEVIGSCNSLIQAWSKVHAAQNGSDFNLANKYNGDIHNSGSYTGGDPLDNNPEEPKSKPKGYYMYRYRVTNGAGGVIVDFSDKDPNIAYRKAMAEAISRNEHDLYSPHQYVVQNLGSKWVQFLTGGYTGKWGKDGRLAMLHEKELVLNKEDTKNMLSAVSVVRDIVNNLSGKAKAMFSNLGMAAIGGIDNNNKTLQQDVVIHAEFPNATNHAEIEEAFDNLVNRASQYANRF